VEINDKVRFLKEIDSMKVLKFFKKEMLILVALLVSVVFFVGQGMAQEIRVEFMASDVSWTNSEYTGHAFMCISITTNTGIKEDCYGFYPKEGSKGFIGGDGVIEEEFKKNPSRFSRIGISLRKRINENIRVEILKLVNDWNNKPYDLTDQSCIDFVVAVLKLTNWTLPARNLTETPRDYLKKVQYENELKPSLSGVWTGKITPNSQNTDTPLSLNVKLENGVNQGSVTIGNDNTKVNCDNLQIALDRSIAFSINLGVGTKINFIGKIEEDLKSMSGTFTSVIGDGKWSLKK
jgi:hypothetical protein